MLKTLSLLPLSFWIAIALLCGGFYYAAKYIRQGIGIPMVALLGTIAFWYVGDVLYNDYQEIHMAQFTSTVLNNAWWQVVEFLAVYLFIVLPLHQRINRRILGNSSQAMNLFRNGVGEPQFQRTLTILFNSAAVVWGVLLILAILRYKERYFYYLFPYLGEHPGPWTINGIAGGGMDTMFVLANNFQMMVGTLFGVVAALSNNPLIRSCALVGVILTWPFFIFSYIRNYILITVIPGLLSWVFFRLRFGIPIKVVALVILFLLVNAWFGFIIANRSLQSTTTALREEGFKYSDASKQAHEGLNMFEELCWINTFIQDGSYKIKWGHNYFANFANPIPRSLWPGKPTIGLDYADARGGGGADTDIGVSVTISDGMIGQGVINCGRYAGPAVAALLIALWGCWVARLDLLGRQIGYFPLFGLGLILTFNMGRDIGPMAMYPLIFGYAICWWLNRESNPPAARQGRKPALLYPERSRRHSGLNPHNDQL